MSSFVFPNFRGSTRGFALLAVLTGILPAAAAPSASDAFPGESRIWRQSAELLVDDALGKLPAARSVHEGAARRELDYARGVLLLDAQPKLQRNIDEARALLESVRRVRADDEAGLNALYLLARIAEYHADPRDPARAAALYAELIALAPGHPAAQLAVPKLAILRLYEDVPPPERRKRLDEFEAAAGRLDLPGPRRDLHFVLAEVCLSVMDDREGALRHLLAAEEAGIASLQLAGDTQVRIALLARQLGHREIAVAHYRKFLSLFERDGRSPLLTAQLQELAPGVPGPTPPPPPYAGQAAPPAAGAPAPAPTP